MLWTNSNIRQTIEMMGRASSMETHRVTARKALGLEVVTRKSSSDLFEGESKIG